MEWNTIFFTKHYLSYMYTFKSNNNLKSMHHILLNILYVHVHFYKQYINNNLRSMRHILLEIHQIINPSSAHSFHEIQICNERCLLQNHCYVVDI